MHLPLLESGRSLLHTTECALVSACVHGTVVWLAVAATAGGRQLPADEREARVFFLLPPDREVVEAHQTEIFQWGRVGVDLEDGRQLTRPGAGPRVSPQPRGARGSGDGSGSRGAVPFGPVSRLPYDSVFSVLDVDRTVERFDGGAAPAYPPDLAALGREGTVRAVFVVDTTGLVDAGSVHVVYSDDPGFTASVVTALGSMRFRPAKREGRTVRQRVEQQFRFRIMPSVRLPPSVSG